MTAQITPDAKHLSNYINGNLKAPAQGKWLDNYCPSTGQVYCQIPESTAEDVEEAVAAAKAAFPAWRALSPAQRSAYLNKIADAIEANLKPLAEAESYDQGKPVSLATNIDIPRAAHNFRYYAGLILHTEEMSTHTHTPNGEALNLTVRNPVGVAGLISPWNLPLYLATWKVAPAIAFGNTCVLKPSELTPMTAFLLSQIMQQIGLPPGVVNIIHGTGPSAGGPMVQHKDVHLVSFTGGTVTGRLIQQMCAPSFKKTSLEMGGKNATVVFDDVDVDSTVASVIRASFTNQGEICLCGSRILVQKGIYDTFVDKFVAAAEKLVVGDPTETTSFMGALVSKQHLEKVLSYVAIAKEEGGTVRCGGVAPTGLSSRCKDGYFLRPTIITGLDNAKRCNQEEIFGPVVTVMPFETEAEAIAIANGTPYGLSASVWTKDVKRANRMGMALEVGTCWINTWMLRDLRLPFGGVKQSGMGREGGKFSVDFYTEVKVICSAL